MSKPFTNRHFILFLLALSFIFFAYFNTFQASWHFDDEPNILTNSKLHLTDFSLQSFTNSLTANPTAPATTKLYRPVPCFTLALNWYFGQNNVFGYHVVNFLIHVCTSWLLFLTLRLILKIHYKDSKNSQFITSAALLGALFWSLAPIQTQAVTYIVQRMASMAAMFTILAIYAYLQGRITNAKNKYFWFTLCFISFFLALGSKENSILLPASLLLIEIAFFQHRITKRQLSLLLLTGTAIIASGFLFVRFGMGIHPFNFLDSYGHRSFTFTERILTEPRILLMYLSQTLIPLAGRLSIDHDIVLSTSFFSPGTTLPAILCIGMAIAVSTRYLKRYPIFTFPILFFFLNHLVESTVIPLELIFEHRNYLPSFFLFLPLSFLIAHALYGPKRFSPVGRVAITLCASLFLIISGYATYTRNLVWANEGTLWTDAIKKAPTSPRAAHNLGRWYRQFGRYDQARYYFQLALQNADKAATPKMTRSAALNGLASVSYMLGQHEDSLQYFDQCLNIDKNDEACLKNRALAYLQLGLPEKAVTDAIYLTKIYPASIEYQYTAALSTYYAGDLKTAQFYVEKVVGYSLDNHQAMQLAGILLMRQQSYPNSLFFLKRAYKLMPDNIDYQLLIAGVYFLSKDFASAEKTLNDIFYKYSIPQIKKALQRTQQYYLNKKARMYLQNELASSIKTNLTLRDE